MNIEPENSYTWIVAVWIAACLVVDVDRLVVDVDRLVVDF